MKHGTRSKYVNDGCRCDDCRRANTEHAADYRRRRAEWRELLPADLVKHGAVEYEAGCRCSVCRIAKSVANRRAFDKRKAAGGGPR